jgi:SAM-dependent methyltransferase
MRPDRDHVHAQFGTDAHLFADGRYMELIVRAEAFNRGSPFTLCECPSLGKGDINLTRDLRETLESGHWVPESGRTRLVVKAPANGRHLTVELRLSVEEGNLSEVHFRFDHSYVQSHTLADTVAFLTEVADTLEVLYGYAHDAFDVALQDALDPQQYRALAGAPPPQVPLDPHRNPARTARLGELLVTCRWLSFYGGRLLERIGVERATSAPCPVERLGEGRVQLRLYDDPLGYSLPDNRQRHMEVRQHLGLDELLEAGRWQAVERRPTGDVADEHVARGLERVPNGDPTDEAVPPISLWAALYDAALTARAGELEFYGAQARRAAGRILEIGCGTGRITLPVARTGVPVVAIDPSAEVIEHLEDRLRDETESLRRRVTVVKQDVRDVELAAHGPFAAIFIPYRGINRFTSPVELRDLLEALRANLQQGGVLAFDTFFPRPERLAPGGQTVTVLGYRGESPDGEGTFLVYDTTDVDLVAQRLSIVRRFDRLDAEGRVVEQRYLLLERRFYFPDELRYLLELAGFEASVFGGFFGETLASPDQEVVVVARRL